MLSIRQFLLRLLLLLGAGIVIIAIVKREKIIRLYKVIHLFDDDVIVANFLNMESIFTVDTIQASESPFYFEHRPGFSLPDTYHFQSEVKRVEDYLNESQTTGMLLIHGDTILYESYFRGNDADQTHISWSVAKSMVSATVGKAIEEGFIDSILDPVTDYVPELKSSGYEGVSIKDILQMSSGVGFDEDYQKFSSDINRLGRYFALGLSLDKFCGSLARIREPGSYHQYVSIDTQVLGMLIRDATGMDFADYFESRIWKPIGAQHTAYWIQDDEGMEAVFGGMNASLTDYGRFAYLYANHGKLGARQILPKVWIESSTTPDGSHLTPGDNPLSSSDLGYGYQWWIPEGKSGEYMAIGVYNQYIYINPDIETIIVKTSANLKYKTEKSKTNHEAIAFFRAIADKIQKERIKKVELGSTF